MVKTEYWHKDHLGSIAATTDIYGGVTNRYAYDPFGKRRYTDGNYDGYGTIVADYPNATDRGFTGHEQLDDIGIVHMNGRLYDANAGRFLQADPFIQALGNLQSYNRYAYVLNNPLNAFDPSGYFSWKKILHSPVVRIVAAIAVAYFTGYFDYGSYGVGIFGAASGSAGAFSAAGLGNALAAGFTGGYISTGTVQGGLNGLYTGAIFFAAGSIAQNLQGVTSGFQAGEVGAVGLHAAAGCISSEISGGKCAQGAVAAGLAEAANDYYSKDRLQATFEHAVVGGTAAVLGGGKFANGTFTGAYGYLFNDLAHRYQLGPTWICDMDQLGCTMRATLDVVDKRSLGLLQLFNGLPVQGINIIAPTNDPIFHYVDTENFKIYNVTLEGHQFYPGQVEHSLAIDIRSRWSWSQFTFQSVDAIYLTTVGTGTGPNQNWNNFAGESIFSFTHSWSQQEMQRRARGGS